MIGKFDSEHNFLSNFSPSPIIVNGLKCPTVEHAYQIYRTKPEAGQDREDILALPPGKAKKKAHLVPQNPTFERRKVAIMRQALQKKFSIPELRTQLLATGEETLVEGNWWHDNCWGDCHCPKCFNTEGQNMLGKLLMELREKLA